MTNNWRPLPGVTNISFQTIPVGAYRRTPWWCWAIMPVLGPLVVLGLVVMFGWPKRP